MRVLIMGSNARTGSSRYADRYVTFAGMIREAHRRVGDDVFIRNWEPGIQHDGWGRIYLGLASPAWIGSDRIFGILIALAELRDGPYHDPRLRFFVDDPDLRVLRNAIASVAKDPSHLFAPFNVKRQDYDLIMDDGELRAKVVRGLALLTADGLPWPTTYFPMFPWGDPERLTKALRQPQRAKIQPVDPTALVPALALLEASKSKPVSSVLVARDQFWLAEAPAKNAWTKTQYVRSPILGTKVGSDAARISLYRKALGVLEPNPSAAGPGWWSSRMVLAALAKTYYASEWRGLMTMEHHVPYVAALPAAYEELNELEQEMLVASQHEALIRSTWTAEQALEALDVDV